MCGIAGVVHLGPPPAPSLRHEVLDRMTDIVRHRGPDDRGVFMDEGVAFGARRLSVIDVAGGHQPVRSEDGAIVAMQNGELYNHAELRRGLLGRGHRLASVCDTEILPHLYEDHPDDFEQRLRGMFGIAVWDGRRRRVTLVRDRLGVKPLYYAVAGDNLVFGSELKSVLASGLVDGGIDDEAVDTYLALGYVPGDRTLLSGVKKLLPGERLVADRKGLRLSRYWHFPAPAAGGPRTTEAWSDELLERLAEAVRLRLMSDVPLGALLSGGLDSSLIVALMARESSGPVVTFSVGFAEAGAASELPFAREVAQRFSTRHHELELSIHDTVDLEELVFHLDEPVADLSSLGFHALCRLAADHVTVALSGQGADELLGGYERYRIARLAGDWDRLPRLGQSAATLLGHGSRRLGRAIATMREERASERLLTMSRRIPADVHGRLRAGRPCGDGARRAFETALRDVRGSLSELAMVADAKLVLPDDMLHYFDRASMAHSLEVRVPFLDHELVEFCATIPPELKARRLTGKYLLKRAAASLLPSSIIDRKKVGFFNPVVSQWFAGQATGAVHDYLLGSDLAAAEHVDQDQVRRLVQAHLAAPSRHTGDAVLTLLMLEVWLRGYRRSVQERGRAAAATATAA
jgi:asparagine synthase (glutamine-hydrolysing)